MHFARKEAAREAAQEAADAATDVNDDEDDPPTKRIKALRKKHTQQVLGGKSGHHPTKTALKHANLRLTLGNISTNAPAIHVQLGTVKLNELLSEMSRYCARYGIDPIASVDEDTEVQIGSRISIWAEGTHVNMGYAYAHPNLLSQERCTACLRFTQCALKRIVLHCGLPNTL